MFAIQETKPDGTIVLWGDRNGEAFKSAKGTLIRHALSFIRDASAQQSVARAVIYNGGYLKPFNLDR